ncbi:hypothetical protein ACQEVZ_45025 [Dactylosporangium sp. CA-152071]|uniref:hypothetical protein n=1 Tax=Dactylosporangium sp. CA-152071 TaxID=3239933 RepID=UPI003D8E7E9F
MGYDLHITRAADPFDAEDFPIGRDEWNGYARRHPAMAEVGWVDWTNFGREAIYAWPAGRDDPCSLSWYSSEVTVTGCREQDIPGLLAIATSLAANLFGDDGERYTEDGIMS